MSGLPPRYRCVIFDLDGTLLDTEAAMLATLNGMLLSWQLQPVTAADMSQARHHGLGAMLQMAFDQQQVAPSAAQQQERARQLITRYLDEAPNRVRLFPDAQPLLRQLQRAGVWIGLCSNQAEGSARHLLDRFGLSDCFREIIGGDSLARRKPDPLPLRWLMDKAGARAADTLLVGDSDVDFQTAANSGTDIVLLRHGLAAATAWSPQRPTLDGFAELRDWLFADAGPAVETHGRNR